MQGKGGGRGAGFGLNMPMSTMNPQHVLAAHVNMGFQNTMLPQGQQPQPQPQQPPQPQPQHSHHMMSHHVGQPQHHNMHASQPFTRNIQANFGSSLGPAHVVPRIPHANIPQQQQQQQQGLAHRIPASSRHPAAAAAAAASGYPVPAKVVPVAQVKAKVQPADAAAAAAAAAAATAPPGAATLVPQTKAASPQSVQNGAGAAGGELLVPAQAGGGGGGAATAAAAAEMMFDMVDFQEMDAQSTQPVTRASAFHPSLPLLVSGDGDGVLYLTRPQPVGGTPSSVGTLQCAGAVSDVLCTEESIYVAAATVRVYSAKEVHEALAAKEEEAAAAKAAAKAENGAEEAAEEEKAGSKKSKKKEGAAAEADLVPALGRLLLDVLPVVSAALPDNNQIPVTLCSHGDDLVVGDSNGRVWRYRFVPKQQQGTGAEEQGASLTVCDEPYSLHRTNVTGIAFDDTRMITSSQDGTVLLSSIKPGESECTQLAPCLLEADRGRRGTKRSVSGTAKHSAGVIACAVNCIAMDSDALWLAIGGDVPYVSMLCLTTGKVRSVFVLPSAEWKVRSLKFHKGMLLVGVDDAVVLKYTLAGKLLSSTACGSDTVDSIAVAPGGDMWAATGKNTNIDLFHV
eukprot:Rhum_TRINITY_DN14382_c28_g1::Rhum_TRINITY_DN14382_c28_g1_i1::g.85415::m.85415